MDLFTYLMAKNGNNSSVHGDLFSYLLGKGQSQTYTVSGTTIYIPDAKKLVSFMMTKESTQDGEPTPDNPVPINVVEGYRNLFNKDNTTTQIGYIKSDGSLSSGGNSTVTSSYTEITPNLNYTVNGFLLETIAFYDNSYNFIKRVTSINTTHYTFNENASYIRIQGKTVDFNINTLQLSKGNQVLPYVPYGSNYIAVNISDGTNTNNYPIPLNNNIIAGIGDYKDELKVDKSGNVFINKKTGKIILDGSQGWGNTTASDGKRFTCNAIKGLVKIPASTSTIADIICDRFISETANDTNSSINGIAIAASGNIIVYYDVIKNYGNTQATQWFASNITTLYYALETPELIDLQTTVDLSLFKGVNNVSNSEDGYMTIEYR